MTGKFVLCRTADKVVGSAEVVGAIIENGGSYSGMYPRAAVELGLCLLQRDEDDAVIGNADIGFMVFGDDPVLLQVGSDDGNDHGSILLCVAIHHSKSDTLQVVIEGFSFYYPRDRRIRFGNRKCIINCLKKGMIVNVWKS